MHGAYYAKQGEMTSPARPLVYPLSSCILMLNQKDTGPKRTCCHRQK